MTKNKLINIIPCLDIKNGKVVKGINFTDIKDIGSPIESAITYNNSGADELVILDITATQDNRSAIFDIAKEIVQNITIPLTLGGGIRCLNDISKALESGVSYVSISSAAFKNPNLISEAADRFGSERIVVALDVDTNINLPSQKEIFINGGTTPTNKDALEFAQELTDLGAGKILLTSKATDGVQSGYDVEITSKIAQNTKLPVIASGGAGKLEDFLAGVVDGKASGLLAASVFHYGILSIKQVKEYLAKNGVNVKL